MAQLTKADGHQIRLRREELGLTVHDLAAKLAKAGHSRHPDHLRNIELGHRQPSVSLFAALVAALETTRERLLARPQRPVRRPKAKV
jgi:transcriptional regulator with XRE-family HTH domain